MSTIEAMAKERAVSMAHDSLVSLAVRQTGRPFDELEALTNEELMELITVPQELEPFVIDPPVHQDGKPFTHRRNARSGGWRL